MNQSGVGVHANVHDAFHKAESRALLLEIQNGEFQIVESFVGSDNESLFQKLRPFIKESDPCIVLLKENGKWVQLAWTPDTASVNLRMLYASSRAGLKVSLGSTYFLPDWHISTLSEFNLSGFNNHIKHRSISTVMTSDEKMADAAFRESQPVSVKHNAMQKLEMRKSPELAATLSQFKDKQITHAVIALSSNTESFLIDSSGKDTEVETLGSALPSKEPRFVLLQLEGDETVLIHYSPEASDKVLKMAYSALKRNLIEYLEKHAISVNRSIQVFDDSDFVGSLLNKNTESQALKSVQQFSKPARPGKGAARLH